ISSSPPPVVVVTVAPGSVELQESQTQQFTATVMGTSNHSVTWSLNPAVGTINPSGLYTAPASITSQQTVTITGASVADPTKKATATVTLTPPVGVTVSPASVTLGQGQKQQFTAAVTNTGNSGVTWSRSPGIGSVNSSGLYTAPASISSQQTVTVTATSMADPSKKATAVGTLKPPVGTSDPDALVELPLDEGAGTVAGDASGMGNDGVLVNGSVFDANTGDGSASAVRFDGVNDSIDLGVLDVNGIGLTLATWFNADSFPGSLSDSRLISKASGTAANDHVFMLSTIKQDSAVRLRARVRVGGSTKTLFASSGDLAAGVWWHAALTYDGVALRLYLDGIEVGSTPLSGAVDVDPSKAVAVGAQPPGAGNRFFDGLIDDVRILQRALTANEVGNLISSSPPPVVVV
ncbi:MAG: hypothetical protein GY953_58675, partial [bacterium]|nr:hypothetical protein [bacterium]